MSALGGMLLPVRDQGAGEERGGGLSDYAEAVLEVVDQVPPGSVTTYGRVAAVLSEAGLGGSARSVGMVMAAYGAAVAWWRVIPADGSPPVHDPAGALARWRAEGVPLREGTTGQAGTTEGTGTAGRTGTTGTRTGRVRADLARALAEVRAPDWAHR